ncbi:competence protein ComEA [Agromyces sp. CF514]|uniref:ComEA family DNA-binding protein n=1 Tax=Agromyces sp. CF514 TaxID=1881031 RepID=UPI0008E91DFA|nr:ComEA family DNA-binding protein [Agromyces sp. CF514]SFR78873.1 competence protein ComEA [Agromyces sp. CF514]
MPADSAPHPDALDPLDHDAFDALDPAARRAGPRVRLAVGAAVVLFVAAVAVAAVLSFASGGGGAQQAIGGAGASSGGVGDRGGADGAGLSGAAGDAAAGSGGGVDEPLPLLVHVLGAVARPGLVELDPGARVVDAVAAAGGFGADADPAGVNLARPVVDGEQLVVYAVGEAPVAGGAGGGGGAAASDGLVHLNTAGVAELDTLPRIGPALAQRILDYRDANGPFTSVDQLNDVTGIGDAVFAGLSDLVAL